MIGRYDATLSVAERKRHGVFYTPETVVRYLLRATAPRGPVADLSCGDGVFLAAAAAAGHHVMGIERDPAALARAEEHLAWYPPAEWSLQCGDGLTSHLPWTPDVVLGNPPYLEAKKSGPALKAHCRALFPDIARGGFDAYVCFVKAGLDCLPAGGRLGYIIPNKFLIADYARPLREYLLAMTTIEEVIDVSDIPTFRDASVYPVLLIVRKSPPPAKHVVRTAQLSDLAQLDGGVLPWTTIPQARWRDNARSICWLPPADPTARTLLDRICSEKPAQPLGTLLDIRWAVSFHRSGLRDEFIFPQPTGRCPRRLLGGKRFHGNADVRRYRTAWSGWWIDYDEERARARRNQFPPASLFTAPKILIAQNARRITATLDTDDYICKDTFLVGRPCAAVPLEYLLGVLNSALLSYLYGVRFKATHVGGAYLHYLAGYLNDLPIRLAHHPETICQLVRAQLNPETTDSARRALDAQLDEAIFDLYELAPEERALVTRAIPYDWGEAGARRGEWDARGEHA
jgi:hypothetical protein